MTGVELIDVTKVYGKTVAVSNVSLSVRKGEFLTLLGPSGCGKTTTLRMIAGFIKPTKGIIRIADEIVNDKPPYQRNTGMVFQNYALFPHMTVYENVAFGLEMKKLPRDEISRQVREALELIMLQGYEERYPRRLSGGEQQRVALARSLVIKPDVLLLDEPLSNLDFKLRQQMRLEIKLVQKKVGITTIYVTHDQGEALIMSDRVAVMEKGSIAQVGSPTEVYDYPKKKFVADFIGETNILEGKILTISGSRATVLADDGLTLYSSPACVKYHNVELEEGSKVSISVRPEKISVTNSKTQYENTFKGKIENLEYMGSNIKYHVRLDNDHKLIASKQILAEHEYNIGDSVYVGWSCENCVLIPY
jgi:spermidine/putrescine ABC transporter ATP-binding subunit